MWLGQAVHGLGQGYRHPVAFVSIELPSSGGGEWGQGAEAPPVENGFGGVRNAAMAHVSGAPKREDSRVVHHPNKVPVIPVPCNT